MLTQRTQQASRAVINALAPSTRSILNLNLIKFQERDIYLNQEYKFQLKIRCNSIVVPALFVDGQFIGVSGWRLLGGSQIGVPLALATSLLICVGSRPSQGAKEVEAMNENGNLQQSLSKFKVSHVDARVDQDQRQCSSR